MAKILLILLILPSVSATGSWICGADFCTEGEEFCRPDNLGEDRCFRCDHFESSCFVNNKHESNCTAWCKDIMEKRLREKDCLEPPEIAHGNYSRTKTTYEQGTEVEYTCKDGHSIRGRKHIACKQFGQWSDPPTCEAVTCLTPKTPKNGQILINSSYPVSEKTCLHIGEIVKYTCDAGYTLIGVSHGHCTNEGQLDHYPPVCMAENSEILYQILLSAVAVLLALLAVSIAANIRSYCKKRKHSKKTISANGHTSPMSEVEAEQRQAFLEVNIKPGATDLEEGPRSNGFIFENEQTSRANLFAVPAVDNDDRQIGSDDSLTDSNTTSDNSAIENTASITNNSSNCNNNTISNGSISGSNNNNGSIVNTNINNNGGHGNNSDSVNNNNINSVGNQTVNIQLQILSVNQPSSPDKTAYETEPTGVGIQEEGEEDATSTKFSDVQPLAPRGHAQPCEHYQPHSNDEGEKVIGAVSAEISSAGQELSKRLSYHQQEQEQQQGPAKITTESGVADHQDFGN